MAVPEKSFKRVVKLGTTGPRRLRGEAVLSARGARSRGELVGGAFSTSRPVPDTGGDARPTASALLVM